MVERAATIAHSPDGFLALWKELALSASVPPTPLEQGDAADSPGPSQPSKEQLVQSALHYATRGEFGKAWAAFSPSATDDRGVVRGLRLADPGEFTRQAFENGGMELTQVEGLADLINADTDEQRRQALSQMGGSQRRQYEAWREQLSLDAIESCGFARLQTGLRRHVTGVVSLHLFRTRERFGAIGAKERKCGGVGSRDERGLAQAST